MIPHPEVIKSLDENRIYQITQDVDQKLKKKYGNISTAQINKLRINKKKQNLQHFDSADYYLELSAKKREMEKQEKNKKEEK